MFKKLTMLAGVMLLSACASVPDSLKVPEGQQLVTYTQVMSNPQINIGKQARWGGTIARIDNKADVTVVEVLSKELKSSARPASSDDSPGRFRVYVKSFLDPMVYQSGRSITFVGQVVGTENGKVGEHQYTYPTLQASGYHMWQVQSNVNVTSYSYGMGYWNRWYGWGYGGLYPYHSRVIIRSNDNPGTSSMGPVRERRSISVDRPRVKGEQKLIKK